MTQRFVMVAAGLVVLTAGALPAWAQRLGSFRWQLQPYCNVVTVEIVQQGGVYTLDGFDDQCGAPQRAPLVGVATPNPDGSIGFGLHIVTVPGGRAVQVDARLTLPSLGGTWRDSLGGSGAFAFNAAGGGSPRPLSATGLPAASITGNHVVAGTLTTTHVADGGLRAVDLLDGPRSAFAGDNQTVAVSAPTVVRTATLHAPGPGTVTITATGVMRFSNGAGVQEVGWCYLGVNGTRDVTRLVVADDGASTIVSRYVPFATTAGVPVTGYGPVVVELVCQEPFPDNTVLAILNSSLSLTYTAQ